MNKNWPRDLRDGCKPPSNLAKLIQTNLSFEKQLEEYENSFEQDETMDIKKVEKKNLNLNFFCAILLF